MFRETEKIAKKEPILLISDGAPNFHESWKNEWKAKQIHHNFIRGNMGIDGKTSSEASGVKVEGNNKWITLI